MSEFEAAKEYQEKLLDITEADAPDTPEGEGDPAQTARAVEALLFVAAEPLTAEQMAEIAQAGEALIEQALELLSVVYAERGLLLRQVAGGWQLQTAPEFAPLIERLYRPKYQQLSAAAMETLAIIAYKQPITRAEISAIRQVDCDAVIGTLLEKKLIAETGRVAGPGRAILYGTSPEFLQFFGLNAISDLPELSRGEEAEDQA